MPCPTSLLHSTGTWQQSRSHWGMVAGCIHGWEDLDHDMSYQHDGSDGPDGNGDGDGDGTTTTTTTITTTMITMRGSSIIAL